MTTPFYYDDWDADFRRVLTVYLEEEGVDVDAIDAACDDLIARLKRKCQ